MIVGAGFAVFGLARNGASHAAHAARATAVPATAIPATAVPATAVPVTAAPVTAAPSASPVRVAGPYAPAMSTGFYTQNRFYRAATALEAGGTIRFSIATKFTERLAIGFDRPVARCESAQGNVRRSLRVFPMAAAPGYAAIAFFSTAARLARATAVSCTLAAPASSLRTDGAALAPLDPIVARYRLEYAAHRNLLAAPRARYPRRDPALQRMKLDAMGRR
jgi:hypothetical protein